MALVVLLRGVNVGGHRTFKPSVLARHLAHLEAVNIGAAGTFVIRKSITRTLLRAELARRLPFDTEIVMCEGRDLLGLMARDPFAAQPSRGEITRFVSFLSKRPRAMPAMPVCFPSSGRWLMKILASDDRFALGVYRRDMKVVGYLGTLDKVFGVPVTTRNWNTITAIATVLGG